MMIGTSVLIILAALQLLLIVRAFAVRGAGGCRPAHLQKLLYRSVLSGIPTFILVTFCVLPSVSRSIFETWSCESFGNDDSSGGTTAYMRTDLSVECGGEEHSRLASLSWALFVLWPVLMPLSYLGLLYYCRESIQRHKPSYLSSSIRFLYREYREQWYWWEVADMGRCTPPHLSQASRPPALSSRFAPLCLAARAGSCSSRRSCCSSTSSRGTTKSLGCSSAR
jgi:hypothetical protein